MKRRLLSWSVVSVSVVFVCAIIIHVSGSLWFLRALLGDLPGEYTVGYYNSFIGSDPIMTPFANIKQEFLPTVSDRYNRFVYKKDAEGEYIVGIPKLSNQFSIINTLREQGWEGRRIGLIVLASNTQASNDPQYSMRNAMSSALGAIFLERLPLRPILILQVGSDPSDPFSFYLERDRKGLHGVANTQATDFSRGRSQRIGKEVVSSKLTYVPIQREVLGSIAKGFVSAIEGRVSDSMQFEKTRPRMIETLLSIGPVGLVLEGSSVAIGVLSTSTQSAAVMSEWINDEQGTRHPIKKAFSLPDKTLGYEYVPGVAEAYFNLNKGNNNCFPTEKYDEELFLCGKDQAVVLSNGEGVGSRLVSLLQDKRMGQRGVVQGDVIDAIGLSSQFEKIEYIILDDTIEVWADRKVK